MEMKCVTLTASILDTESLSAAVDLYDPGSTTQIGLAPKIMEAVTVGGIICPPSGTSGT